CPTHPPPIGPRPDPASPADTTPRDRALALTDHQPATVQQVRTIRLPVLLLDPRVIDIGTALPDGAPRGPLAVRQAGSHQQLDDRRLLSQVDLTTRRLRHRCVHYAWLQLTQFTYP